MGLLGVNTGIAKNIVEACAKFCPDAILGLIVNPVNSVVPAMCELYKKAGLDPKKICGVTSLDIVRANKFVHEQTSMCRMLEPTWSTRKAAKAVPHCPWHTQAPSSAMPCCAASRAWTQSSAPTSCEMPARAPRSHTWLRK